ncbi:MAG: efflux RND transporter periplasmic adaptor subunit [Gemmatimonadetes bacterium]|nr:efflux RND transporter periplasmic adaptor subunit [Gemmatimonadota bacterium]
MNKWVKVFLPLAIILGSLLILVFLVRSRPVVESKPPAVPPPLVRATTAILDTVQLTVRSQGAVMPRTESALSAETDGQIVYVSPSFVPGGFFEEDELLVRLDPRDAELAVTRAAADTARFATAMQIEQEEARLAQDEWRRLGSGAPMPLVLREPQLAQARANLEASVAALEQAKLNLERTEIRAPYAGRVRKKNVDVGQFLRRGEALATIYAINYAEIRLPIPDEELAFFDTPMQFRGETGRAAGPPVVISTEFAGRQHSWNGRVVRMEGEIDPMSRMVYAVARVQNPYGRGANPDRPPLGIGMFIEAEILGKHYPDVAALPRTAMHGENRIGVIDEENRLRFRNVEVLRIESDRVLILSGIETGERVCLSALETQVDGMEVRILDSSSSGPVVQEQEGTGK